MKNCYTGMTVTGTVREVEPAAARMRLELLSKEAIWVSVSKTTWYEVLRNVGDEVRDRVSEPSDASVEAAIGKRSSSGDPAMWDAKRSLMKYARPGTMVSLRGVASLQDGEFSLGARKVSLMHSEPGRHGWEQTHWWLQQINTLFEQWMDVLFDDRREVTENDFASFYRTNLDLFGGKTGDDVQECATMSRFLYGLSSSYLMTGNDRALSAARACAKYMVNAFSVLSHDRMYCFWKFGRKHDRGSTKEIIGSLNPDDLGSYALYEQIYALAGLTQYYRITQDTTILSFITRTIASFEKFFLDEKREGDPCFTGKGGYFSHIDPATMRPDSDSLGSNKMRKNWNSIGDHIPAYMVNLLLAIDPIPRAGNEGAWSELLRLCRKILDECVDNILEHFPPRDGSLFVNERFHADWSPDHEWGWQQNRGIVGHNLKISWNLTRCGHYYASLAERFERDGNRESADRYRARLKRCYELATTLGRNMDKCGVDQIRGGIFDALERNPADGKPTEFTWESTKDFWQQEQAILAYYLMSGLETSDSDRFLELARHCTAFWNLYFVDQENRKIYFRTTESGAPVVQDGYGIQAGHAIAGYHSFELNYLAHFYIRTYAPSPKGEDESFCVTFCPNGDSGIKSLNVLPDFFRPGDVKIIAIRFNGQERPVDDPHRFQIDISGIAAGAEVEVEFFPIHRDKDGTVEDILRERHGIANLRQP
jgi:hypothetical protein